MLEIKVPRDNVNDQTVMVNVVHITSGSKISKGDIIVDIETSKTTIEVTSPVAGILNHSLVTGMEVNVGETLFIVSETEEPKIEIKTKNNQGNISNAAYERATKLGVNLETYKKSWITSEQLLSSSSDKKIIVYGGGGHAKMCIDILQQYDDYELLGVIDNKIPIGSKICGTKVIGDDSALAELYKSGVRYAINGIGSVTNPPVRKVIFDKLKAFGFVIPNLIHPSAVIEPSVALGEGNQIMMAACIGSDAKLGNNCIVNSGSIVSHDCILHDHSHISPGAVLAGQVTVGELSVIGMGVTVYIGKYISANTVVKNGENIFSDL